VTARSLVKGNLSAWTLSGGDNVHIEDGSGTRLEGNHSIEHPDTDEGIQVDSASTGNLIIQNSASGDTGIKFGPGNHGDNGSPASLSGDHAWINFEYVP